jgi:hypothetical protein
VYISPDGEEGRPLIGSALQNALDEGRIDRTQLTFPIKDGHIEDWALVETILYVDRFLYICTYKCVLNIVIMLSPVS